MQASMSTPRVLPKHLAQFGPSTPLKSTNIRILGQCSSISSESITLTCDVSQQEYSTVTCLLNRESHMQQGKYYEVLGKVINLEGGHGLGVKVLTATEWIGPNGAKPDMAMYEAVVNATHRYPEMFYGDGTA